MSGAETSSCPRTAGRASGLGGSWRVIVLNDNHNTFDGVAGALARVIPGVTLDQGYAIADRIHNTGQAIVWSGPQGAGRALLGAAERRGADDGAAGAGLRSGPVPPSSALPYGAAQMT